MAGLMDFMGGMFGGGDVYGDLLSEEQKKAMQQQTMMTMAAKLLQAGGPSPTRTNLGQAIGGAFLSGQEAYGKAGQTALTQMLTKQKIDEYKRGIKTNEAIQGILSGNAPAAGQAPVQMPDPNSITLGAQPQSSTTQMGQAGMRPQMAGSQMQALNPNQQQIARLTQAGNAIMAIDPTKGAQFISAAKSLQDMNQQPEMIRTMTALGLPITTENYERLKKAGANTVTNIQNAADKSLANASGPDVIKEMRSATDQALAARQSLSNISLIRENTSQAILGPAADMRTWMLRAGSILGVAGKDADDVLSKTRSVVQGMAREELNAAASMKGQGPLTDNERGILRKAALGDQSLTAPELDIAMQSMEKIANAKISRHGALLQNFSNIPGMKQVVPFYTVGGGLDNMLDAEMNRRGLK